jgi:hypothetical protein
VTSHGRQLVRAFEHEILREKVPIGMATLYDSAFCATSTAENGLAPESESAESWNLLIFKHRDSRESGGGAAVARDSFAMKEGSPRIRQRDGDIDENCRLKNVSGMHDGLRT